MDLHEMTFGVEIECFIPNDALRVERWVVGGYHSRRSGIPGCPGWNATSDASIRPDPGYSGVEVVSGILKGLAGLASVNRMAAKLAVMGARVNASCGFHVHVGVGRPDPATGTGVDVSSLDIPALVRLVHLVANVEPGLYASTGVTYRQSGGYAYSVKRNFSHAKGGKATNLNGLKRVVGPNGAGTAGYSRHDSRMHVLNLMNLFEGRQPTVEFRVFGGIVNPNMIRAYAQLCLGLVQMAHEYTRTVPWDAAPPRPPRFTGGMGEREVKRMLVLLGWVVTPGLSYGPQHKHPKAYGALESTDQASAMLMALGANYDARTDDLSLHNGRA